MKQARTVFSVAVFAFAGWTAFAFLTGSKNATGTWPMLIAMALGAMSIVIEIALHRKRGTQPE